MAQRKERRAHEPADGGRQSCQVGRAAGRRTERRRRLLGRMRGPILGPLRQFVSRWATGCGDQRTHLFEARIEHVFGRRNASSARHPTSRRQRRAPHDARSPDVAVDAALITQPVRQSGLGEQLIELRLMFRRHIRAHLRDALVHIRCSAHLAGDRDPDRAQQRVRHLYARTVR